jgi:hypothetical protein
VETPDRGGESALTLARRALVLAAVPNCPTLDDGRPILREKIGYLLSKSGADYESMRRFVETDVDGRE